MYFYNWCCSLKLSKPCFLSQEPHKTLEKYCFSLFCRIKAQKTHEEKLGAIWEIFTSLNYPSVYLASLKP